MAGSRFLSRFSSDLNAKTWQNCHRRPHNCQRSGKARPSAGRGEEGARGPASAGTFLICRGAGSVRELLTRAEDKSGSNARTERHGMAPMGLTIQQRGEDPSGSTITGATASRSSAFRAATARITPARHAAISWMPGRLLATTDPLNETPLHELARLTSPHARHRVR